MLHPKDPEQFKNYCKYLTTLACLSRLYSDNTAPYIGYRAVENIFCESFQGDNFSRADTAYDARIGRYCFGIKTFIDKEPWQKIAEFNKQNKLISSLKEDQLVLKLAELRNERICFANNLYSPQESYYHCVTRNDNMIYIFEEHYQLIDIHKIRDIKNNNASIEFTDTHNNYRYNFSKSTLYKKFNRPANTFKIEVNILKNPLGALVEYFEPHIRTLPSDVSEGFFEFDNKFPVLPEEYVILPLYAISNKLHKEKEVQEKSALNQWNAGGRARDYGEVYIPIPRIIQKEMHNFFPSRDKHWQLITPSNETLTAKVCQEGGKALMTKPNKALSDWLLRGVLNLRKGELLEYSKLEKVGVDSVKVTKLPNDTYKIDFTSIGSYEKFEKKLQTKDRNA